MPGLVLRPPPMDEEALPLGDAGAVDAVTGADQQAIESIGIDQLAPVAQPIAAAPTAPQASAVPAPAPVAAGAPPAPALAPGPGHEQTQLELNAEAAGQLAEKARLQHEKALAEAAAGRELAARDAAAAKEQADLHDRLAPVLAKRLEARDAAVAKASGAGFRSYWAGKTTGDKIAAGIGLIASGWASGLAGAAGHPMQNQAVKLLTEDMDRDFAQQQAEIARLGDAEKMARTGVLDAEQADKRLRDALATHQLAARQAVISKLAADMKAFGAKDADVEANAAITALKQKQADAKRAIDRQDALDAQKKALDESTIQLHGAQAGAAGARAARDQRKAAGAGAGSGLALGPAAEEWLRGRDEAKTAGKPWSNADEVAEAFKRNIPLEAKAGRVSLKTLRDMGFKERAADRGDARLDLQEDKKLTADVDKWAKSHEIEKIQKTQDEISATLKLLHDDPNNPHVQSTAFEKSISAARGGAATKTALELGLAHMSGVIGSIDAFYRKLDKGTFGGEQMTNLVKAMRDQFAAQQQRGSDAYDAFEKYRKTLPPEQQDQAIRERTKIFSGLSGFGGKNKAAEPTGASIPPGATLGTQKSTGRRGYMLDGKFTAL